LAYVEIILDLLTHEDISVAFIDEKDERPLSETALITLFSRKMSPNEAISHHNRDISVDPIKAV